MITLIRDTKYQIQKKECDQYDYKDMSLQTLTPLSTTPLLAFLLSAALHLLALRLFPRWNLLDFPERYGLSRARLPYPTGIVSVAAFALLFPLIADWSTPSITVLSCSVILAVSCFADDRHKLSPLLRLLVQAGIGFALFLGGIRIYSLTNPLDALTGIDVLSLDSFTIDTAFAGSLPVMSGIFTILWIMLTTNALNWFDGIPGQVNTISVLGFLTIGLLSLSDRVAQPELALLSLSLAGIALGSLFTDFPPAKALIGDTGSMFFGLMLGVLTIYSGGKVATAFLVLGVPLIDVLFVVIRRIFKGQSPLQGNATDQHLHHRLLAKGWSGRQVILLTAGLGTAFGVTALFLDTAGKFIAALVLLLVMMGLSFYSRPGSIKSKPV